MKACHRAPQTRESVVIHTPSISTLKQHGGGLQWRVVVMGVLRGGETEQGMREVLCVRVGADRLLRHSSARISGDNCRAASCVTCHPPLYLSLRNARVPCLIFNNIVHWLECSWSCYCDVRVSCLNSYTFIDFVVLCVELRMKESSSPLKQAVPLRLPHAHVFRASLSDRIPVARSLFLWHCCSRKILHEVFWFRGLKSHDSSIHLLSSIDFPPQTLYDLSSWL